MSAMRAGMEAEQEGGVVRQGCDEAMERNAVFDGPRNQIFFLGRIILRSCVKALVLISKGIQPL